MANTPMARNSAQVPTALEIVLQHWAGQSTRWPPAAVTDREKYGWSPSHGDTAFTVPMFDQFMLRLMPEGDWE